MKPANRAPIYAACVYPKLAELCRKYGYALAVHGSLARDFDLICIPWTETVATPEFIVGAITKKFAVKPIGSFENKGHGRLAITLSWAGEAFMDLSFVQLPPALRPIPEPEEA